MTPDYPCRPKVVLRGHWHTEAEIALVVSARDPQGGATKAPPSQPRLSSLSGLPTCRSGSGNHKAKGSQTQHQASERGRLKRTELWKERRESSLQRGESSRFLHTNQKWCWIGDVSFSSLHVTMGEAPLSLHGPASPASANVFSGPLRTPRPPQTQVTTSIFPRCLLPSE